MCPQHDVEFADWQLLQNGNTPHDLDYWFEYRLDAANEAKTLMTKEQLDSYAETRADMWQKDRQNGFSESRNPRLEGSPPLAYVVRWSCNLNHPSSCPTLVNQNI